MAQTKIRQGQISGGLDGWIPANETWAYDSATTITVPSGAASKYQKGDKIKLTQTTAKYFYVVSVADTVLTVTGGSDYTVADAAITSPYFSKIENPQGFPHWFNYTATYSGFSSDPGSRVERFKISGNQCTVVINHGSNGTSNANNFTISAPVNAADQGIFTGMTTLTIDNNAVQSPMNRITINDSSGAGTIDVYKAEDRLGWTTSNGKRCRGQISYEI